MTDVLDFPPQLYDSPADRMRDEELHAKCRADVLRLINEVWTGDEMDRVGCQVLMELGATYAVRHTGKDGAKFLLDMCRQHLDRWESEWQEILDEEASENS